MGKNNFNKNISDKLKQKVNFNKALENLNRINKRTNHYKKNVYIHFESEPNKWMSDKNLHLNNNS